MCEQLKNEKFIMEFNTEKYNINSNYVKKAIASLSNCTRECHICSTCDKKLLSRNVCKCVLCTKACARHALRVVKNRYFTCNHIWSDLWGNVNMYEM